MQNCVNKMYVNYHACTGVDKYGLTYSALMFRDAALKAKRKPVIACKAALAQAEGKVVDFYELLNVWSRNPASYIPVQLSFVMNLKQ